MSRFSLFQNKSFVLHAHDRVLKASDYAALLSAEQFVEHAREEARKIVDDAKTIYESEKQRGYRDGREEAKAAQAEKMMSTMIESVHYFSEVENKLVVVVMSATEKILSDFDDLELTRAVVKQALDKVRNESKITLWVCSQHADAIRAQLKEITAHYGNIAFIDVMADSRLAAATCKVETEMGSVDTSIDRQLQALRTALANNFTSQPRREE